MIIPVVNKRIKPICRPLAVVNEHKPEPFEFDIRFEGCAGLSWYLVWENEEGEGQTVLLEATPDGTDRVSLKWDLVRTVAALPGRIKVMLKGLGEDGMLWETIPSTMDIVNCIAPENAEEKNPTILDMYLVRFNEVLAECKEYYRKSTDYPSEEEVDAALEEAWNG